jgi:hypothetical protein
MSHEKISLEFVDKEELEKLLKEVLELRIKTSRIERLSEWLAEADNEIMELWGQISKCHREIAKLRAEKIPRIID